MQCAAKYFGHNEFQEEPDKLEHKWLETSSTVARCRRLAKKTSFQYLWESTSGLLFQDYVWKTVESLDCKANSYNYSFLASRISNLHFFFFLATILSQVEVDNTKPGFLFNFRKSLILCQSFQSSFYLYFFNSFSMLPHR